MTDRDGGFGESAVRGSYWPLEHSKIIPKKLILYKHRIYVSRPEKVVLHSHWLLEIFKLIPKEMKLHSM